MNNNNDSYMEFPKTIDPNLFKQEERTRNLYFASTVLMYVNLFSLTFLIMSILSTRNRIFAFFESNHFSLPELTKVLLITTPEEYMFMCIMAAFLLVAKERWEHKKLTFIINIIGLIAIWFSEFFYIWGISLPFNK